MSRCKTVIFIFSVSNDELIPCHNVTHVMYYRIRSNFCMYLNNNFYELLLGPIFMKLIITSRVKKAVKCECHVIPSNLYVLLPLSIFVDVTTNYCFMFYHLSSKKKFKAVCRTYNDCL